MVTFLCFAVTFFPHADPNSLYGTKLIFPKFVCLIALNFIVGIASPVGFKNLIESSYMDQHEMELKFVFSERREQVVV